MHHALVQAFYSARSNHECPQISNDGAMRNYSANINCEIAADGVVCGPVLVGTLLAPTQGLQFHALHPLSFLFICTLHWYKHCTVLEVTTDVRKISNDGGMRNCSTGTNLQARPRRYAFCTDPGFTFSGSPST